MLRLSLAVVVLLFLVGFASAAEPPKVAELVRQLEKGTPGERVIAAERLGDLGPEAVDAIPALARAVATSRRLSVEGNATTSRANRYLHTAALDALASIGPKAAPALVELLPSEWDDNFSRVPEFLESFGRDAALVVPALAKLLADKNQDHRVTVARILEAIGPVSEPAIPELIALFLNPKNKNDGRWGSGPIPPPPRVAAVRALVRIGPKGVTAITESVLPVLVEELRTGEHRPGGTPLEILSVLGETGGTVVPRVVDIIKDDKRFEREEAGRTLLYLGAAGRKSFRELIASPDADVRLAMLESLNRYLTHERFPRYYRFEVPPLDITPFVPALVAALKDAEPKHRLAAAEILCSLGEKAPPDVADAVIALYREPAIKKYLEAEKGLTEPRLAVFGATGVRALVQLLDSDSLAVQKIAIEQLTYSPQKWATEALPRLRKLTEHKNSELALGAAYTATVLSLDAKDAAPIVSRRFIQSADAEVRLDAKDAAPIVSRRFIQSADAEVRLDAAQHLHWVGSLGVPHHEALIPLLDDKDDKVVQEAASAIYYHAPKGSAAARALVARKLVQNPSSYRFSKAPAAEPIVTPPGIEDWIESLTDGADHMRVSAALNLGDKGAAAKAAVPTLKKILTDPDPDLRFAAAYALARIGNDQPALRQLLRAEMERAARGRPATWVAAEAFKRLPPDYPEVIPLVAKWIELIGGSTLLMDGLLKYGPKAKDAVPALRKVLRGPTVPVRHYFGSELKPTCELLGAIGPDAKDALPELRDRLESVQIEVALAARDAIQKITGGK